MQFSAIKENLTDALQIVQRALSSKNTMAILSGIHLTCDRDQLTMTASDLEVRLEVTVPVEVIEPGETVVQGRGFTDLVRRLPDGRIIFHNTSKDGADHMTISYGDNTADLYGWPGREYPTFPPAESPAEVTLTAKDFSEAVSHTAFAVNADEVRPVFTGLLFQIRGHELTVVGTDSFRLAKKITVLNNKNGADHDLIIPVRALNEWARIVSGSEDPVELEITDRQVLFKTAQIRLLAQRIRGDFPPFDKVIPSGWQTYVKLERKPLLDALDRATLFSREKDGTFVVTFHIENNLLHISTASDYGKVDEHLPVYQEGEVIDISFNARYLIDALKAMDDSHLDVTFNGSMGPCVMKPQAGEDYLYLILPLRR
ncbi:DNA polymerase III subunit beta [Peptococcus simiae]|uniref:DNA polymerase III subunit beta n=1 Tax=Peptococcus simiae TaxID=1643805 RepID=UPI0039812D7A